MYKFVLLIVLQLQMLPLMADDIPFTIINGLFDARHKETMGLDYAPHAETYTVWAAGADIGNPHHYANGVVMTAFKDRLYCMWQTSLKDEDAQDTYVAYAYSNDGGLTWSKAATLCPSIDNGYCTSGGWVSTGDKLIGYINVRRNDISNNGGYTQYVESEDGITWTDAADVMMDDGSRLNGIIEQDPHILPDGRIISAAHFQPGLKLCPIYTDDPTGRTGWKKGSFAYTENGSQSAELEPSFFIRHDGVLVMVMRDQKSSYRVLAATSSDRGETWTKAVVTNMPDSRAKQCAGNLPDGTAFMVNNPGRVTNSENKTWRVPLALTLSTDGQTFDRSYLVRSGADGDYPVQRYAGKAKTLGYSYPKAVVYGNYLYISYSTNKEDVQVTRVPLNDISVNTGICSPPFTDDDVLCLDGNILRVSLPATGFTLEVYDVLGQCQMRKYISDCYAEISLGNCSHGVLMIRARAQKWAKVKKVFIK